MNITLRADEANRAHTEFTVFCDGANCGQLRMSEKEAFTFYTIVQNGCHPDLDTFLGKGHWLGVVSESEPIKTEKRGP